MNDLRIYNQEGTKIKDLTLPRAMFAAEWNPVLVTQVIRAIENNARTSIAHVKDRSEVSGGGKKPWRQKGTGQARHGSTRSPIWTKGGKTFGPRNDKDYSQTIPKKMKYAALVSVLSKKHADNAIVGIDMFSFDTISTKIAAVSLKKLSEKIEGFSDMKSRKRNSALVVLAEKNEIIEKSFRNFKNIVVKTAQSINARDIMKYKYTLLVSPEKVSEVIMNRNIKKKD